MIMADEPTGNLDSKNGKEVMELLMELNDEGTTIIMATHSQRATSYANRIVNMLDGFLVDKNQIWDMQGRILPQTYFLPLCGKIVLRYSATNDIKLSKKGERTLP